MLFVFLLALFIKTITAKNNNNNFYLIIIIIIF